MSIVIVAIPREEEAVWELSSEKVPHLTLLYLGDGPLADEENVVKYIQHVAATSLREFGMTKERRGRLGPDNADVLFFEKGWDNKSLETVRTYLLKNEAIAQAYLSAKQYNMWTPHLTMGYPTNPAKTPKDPWQLNYIQFDRLAIWFGDSEGPEFPLRKQFDDLVPIEHGIGDLVKKVKKGADKTDDFVRDKSGKFAKTAGQTAEEVKDALEESGEFVGKSAKEVAELVAKIFAVKRIDRSTNRSVVLIDGRKIDNTKPSKSKDNFNPKSKLDRNQVDTGTDKVYRDMSKKEKADYDKRVNKAIDDQEKWAKNPAKLNPKKKVKHDAMSLDDVLQHHGVKGMRWGVRRRTDGSGLAIGLPPGLKNLGRKPKETDPLAEVIRKAEKGKNTHEDHKKLVENLDKTVASLSTADINAINARIKSVQKLKENTTAIKEAKASYPKKLLKFALDSAKTGAKTYADDLIKELTEDVLGIKFGNTRAGAARAKQKARETEEAAQKARKNSSDDDAPAANAADHPNYTTKSGGVKADFGQPTPQPSPERMRALETLADQIARQNG